MDLFVVVDTKGSGRIVAVFDAIDRAQLLLAAGPNYYQMHHCQLNAINASALDWVDDEQRPRLEALIAELGSFDTAPAGAPPEPGAPTEPPSEAAGKIDTSTALASAPTPPAGVSATELAPTTAPTGGDRLGQVLHACYRLDRLVGPAGEHLVCYEALHLGLDRPVWIKLAEAGTPDEQIVALRQEVQQGGGDAFGSLDDGAFYGVFPRADKPS